MITLSSADCSFACSKPPTWKRLVNHTLTIDERVSIITSIFSDRNEVEMDEHPSGDDAQTFVDNVYEVRVPHNSMSRVD